MHKSTFKKSLLLASTFASAFLVSSGCTNPGTEKEAMDQFSPEIIGSAKTKQERMKGLYQKVGGKYDALSAADKAEFVTLNNGSEITAQQSWGYLATAGKAGNFGEEQKAANRR
ncbi:hypothetical protein BH11ARM2_BH11ARM2_18790 [soil metagenome]